MVPGEFRNGDVSTFYDLADVFFAERARDRIWGGTGNDYLRGDSQNDTLDGEGDVDNCYGGSGDDVLKHCEK